VTVRPPLPVRLGRIELAGRIVAGHGLPSRATRRYPSHAVVLVTSGRGSYRSERHDHAVRAGSLIIVRPGEPHWYGTGSADLWDESYCAFNGPVFDLAARQGGLGGPERVMSVGDPERFAAYLDRVRLAAPPPSCSAQDVEALELLAAVEAAISPTIVEEPATNWLARSMQVLAADGEPRPLPDVAAAVGMGYESWRRRFREHLGIPPAQYRREVRLNSSATLLAMTSLSIDEIAHRTGFVDDRHLARHFVRRYGVTPGRYRKARPADATTDGSQLT
jgi:AraC-like DNA-binding protein